MSVQEESTLHCYAKTQSIYSCCLLLLQCTLHTANTKPVGLFTNEAIAELLGDTFCLEA